MWSCILTHRRGNNRRKLVPGEKWVRGTCENVILALLGFFSPSEFLLEFRNLFFWELWMRCFSKYSTYCVYVVFWNVIPSPPPYRKYHLEACVYYIRFISKSYKKGKKKKRNQDYILHYIIHTVTMASLKLFHSLIVLLQFSTVASFKNKSGGLSLFFLR